MKSDQAEHFFLASAYNVPYSVCTSLCLIPLQIISLRFKNLLPFSPSRTPYSHIHYCHSFIHACTQAKLTHTHTLEALCGMSTAWESDSKRKEALESELSLQMSLRGASFLSLSFPLSFSSFFPSLSPSLLFPLALSNHARLQWYSDSPRTK